MSYLNEVNKPEVNPYEYNQNQNNIYPEYYQNELTFENQNGFTNLDNNDIYQNNDYNNQINQNNIDGNEIYQNNDYNNQINQNNIDNNDIYQNNDYNNQINQDNNDDNQIYQNFDNNQIFQNLDNNQTNQNFDNNQIFQNFNNNMNNQNIDNNQVFQNFENNQIYNNIDNTQINQYIDKNQNNQIVFQNIGNFQINQNNAYNQKNDNLQIMQNNVYNNLINPNNGNIPINQNNTHNNQMNQNFGNIKIKQENINNTQINKNTDNRQIKQDHINNTQINKNTDNPHIKQNNINKNKIGKNYNNNKMNKKVNNNQINQNINNQINPNNNNPIIHNINNNQIKPIIANQNIHNNLIKPIIANNQINQNINNQINPNIVNNQTNQNNISNDPKNLKNPLNKKYSKSKNKNHLNQINGNNVVNKDNNLIGKRNYQNTNTESSNPLFPRKKNTSTKQFQTHHTNFSNDINQNHLLHTNQNSPERTKKNIQMQTDYNKMKNRKYFDSDKLNNNKINNNNNKPNKTQKINPLKLNEEILLRNQKETINKDLDIKSHFDIEVTKDSYLFHYKKVLKIAIPLLSHYEMPSNCEYKSPILSPDGQYLSCIAKADTDIVYVWDIDDLYWYKFKFFCPKTKIDFATFTPDSKSILIIYRRENPALYNLKNGKKMLEFEKIGDENKLEGVHCAFTVKAAHFGYTTDKSFILWSMKTGKIKIQIKDESPMKLLFNEFILSIKNDLNCYVRHIKTLKIHLSFKLKGLQNPNEILDARITPDMSCFIYVIKQGIIKYIFKEKKFKGLQKFQAGVEKATISDDCRFVVKTNMRNLTIYDIDKGDTIGTILKEKFNEFRIDFNNEKLIVIDNICINIHDYTDGGIPEQFVWLNKNPFRFLDAKFSRDYKILFALIDQNNVIAYDLNTGLIVKKWQNINKNWTNFSISEYNKIATNSDLFLVKVWNYITGREDATFYGFDSHSFHFSSNGNYLACGAKNGPENARIWDIEKGTFGSFPYVGNNSNFHTVVNLTSPEPTRLICCSIDQQPLIFDTNSKELLYKCECLYRFEEIYEIKSDQTYDVFIVKGRDVKKREIGLLYRISDGILLETYENYTVLELAKDQGVIISKCDNVNGGKLTATDVKNLSDPILNDFQIQTDKINLLNDNKCVVIVINEEEYKKEYCLLNAEDGGYFGKINFIKKTERNSENYITVDPIEEFLYFRYFEFLSPQESREFRNRFMFRNSE